MRHCTAQGAKSERVLFEGAFDKPLVAVFDGERQSDMGGATLLGAVDRRMGLTQRLCEAIRDPRQAGKVEHSTLEMVRQRVYGIACGFADVNDATRLRDDPAMRLLCGRGVEGEEERPASAPGLCRLENRATRRDLVKMSHALLEHAVAHQGDVRRRGKVKRVTVDVDPSDDPTHGEQQLSFFNGHYDTWCYLPLFAYVTFHGKKGREEPEQHLVAAILRPGNASATQGARGLLRRLVERLRTEFPAAAIRVRLDGGYGSGDFLDFLESLGVEYVVNLAGNARLRAAAEEWLEGVRPVSEATGASERLYGECRYAAKSWSKERRVVIKAEIVRCERTPQKAAKDNARFVATNLACSPKHLYERVYCRRGDVENRIKELNHGMESDRTSCTSFRANQFRLLLTAAAYALMQEIRRLASRTPLARAQVWKLREHLLLLGARVVESTRRLLVRMSSASPFRDAWLKIARAAGAAPA
jgi:hypothetical protein